MPLPIAWRSDEVRTLIDYCEAEFDGSGTRQRKAAREVAAVGAWSVLQTMALNFLYGKAPEGFQARAPSVVQRALQKRLLNQAEEFTGRFGNDDKMEVVTWAKEMGKHFANYDQSGSTCALQLKLQELLPGLPPPGFGGCLDPAIVCSSEVNRALNEPDRYIRPRSEWPGDLSPGRVLCSEGE